MKNELGKKPNKTPENIIISTPCWKLTQSFGFWGRQEHHSMTIEDFSYRKDKSGATHIVFVDGLTKTRQIALYKKSRFQLTKMFETQPETCPV